MTKLIAALLALSACANQPIGPSTDELAVACEDVAAAACSSAAACPNPKYSPDDVERICAASVAEHCEHHALSDVMACDGDAWAATCHDDGTVTFDVDSAACLATLTR